MKVLFVCRANVARSQIAESFFNYFISKYGKKHTAESAGSYIEGRTGKIIGEVSPSVVKCMAEAEIDVSHKKIKRLTNERIKKADIVVLLDRSGNFPDEIGKAKRVIIWDVKDTKGKDLDFHRKIRDEIKERVEKFVEKLD